jgi:NADPH:quinone reductase-like Zn-dependent oxidoreductase
MSDLSARIARLSPEQRAKLVRDLAMPRARQESKASSPVSEREAIASWSGFCCAPGTPGHFEGIRFRPLEPIAPGPGQVQIRARAVSLNFRDLMIAMGMYPPTPGVPSVMGSDYAGEIVACGEGVTSFSPGDRVLALSAGSFTPDGRIVEDSHFCSVLNVSAFQAVRMPENLSFEAAAGVPTVYLTSYYALRDVARLARGERVLIHSATGGVGLAAVQIAQWIGAELYTTAGSDSKRALLRSLGVAAAMDSRTTAFADEILEQTRGEGVDVILNTLPGDAGAKGLALLRPFGRFLQIDKQDVFRNAPIALGPFKHGLTFAAIDLSLFLMQPERLQELFLAVTDHLRRGDFAPVRSTVFPVTKLAEALTLMSRSTHIGKLVLSYV